MLDEDNRQLKPDSRQQQPISPFVNCEIGAILFLLMASPIYYISIKNINCGITFVCLTQDSHQNSVISYMEIARIQFYGFMSAA